MYWTESSLFEIQDLLRKTNPENFSLIGKLFLKYNFSKAEISRFEETSFGLSVKEILKIRPQ